MHTCGHDLLLAVADSLNVREIILISRERQCTKVSDRLDGREVVVLAVDSLRRIVYESQREILCITSLMCIRTGVEPRTENRDTREIDTRDRVVMLQIILEHGLEAPSECSHDPVDEPVLEGRPKRVAVRSIGIEIASHERHGGTTQGTHRRQPHEPPTNHDHPVGFINAMDSWGCWLRCEWDEEDEGKNSERGKLTISLVPIGEHEKRESSSASQVLAVLATLFSFVISPATARISSLTLTQASGPTCLLAKCLNHKSISRSSRDTSPSVY